MLNKCCVQTIQICKKEEIYINYAWLLKSIDFLSMVFEMNVQYFLQERDLPIKISLGWNKISGCHTKLTLATFLLTWKWFSQYMLTFALAIVACQHELERLGEYIICKRFAVQMILWSQKLVIQNKCQA